MFFVIQNLKDQSERVAIVPSLFETTEGDFIVTAFKVNSLKEVKKFEGGCVEGETSRRRMRRIDRNSPERLHSLNSIQ